MVVAVNYNTDVGDAWEFADSPKYPEQMTELAGWYGIDYIIYAMTHCMRRTHSVAGLVVAAGLLCAQSAILNRQVDVASIKPADPALTAMNNHFSADRFTLINYAAKALIEERVLE